MGADRAEKFHATKVDEHDRNKEISDLYEIEGWTGFDFEARMKTEHGRKLSEMKWGHIHFVRLSLLFLSTWPSGRASQKGRTRR